MALFFGASPVIQRYLISGENHTDHIRFVSVKKQGRVALLLFCKFLYPPETAPGGREFFHSGSIPFLHRVHAITGLFSGPVLCHSLSTAQFYGKLLFPREVCHLYSEINKGCRWAAKKPDHFLFFHKSAIHSAGSAAAGAKLCSAFGGIGTATTHDRLSALSCRHSGHLLPLLWYFHLLPRQFLHRPQKPRLWLFQFAHQPHIP